MKIYLNDLDGEEIEVTNRKIILWGSGKFAVDICRDYNLNNISFVIDTDRKKEGRVVVLGNERIHYTVSSPDIIRDLDASEYFIIVGSLVYKDEICELIRMKFSSRFPVCGLIWKDLIYEYESFITMCTNNQKVRYWMKENRKNIFDIQRKLDGFLEAFPSSCGRAYRFISCREFHGNLCFSIDCVFFVKIKGGRFFKNLQKYKTTNFLKDNTGEIIFENYYNAIIDWRKNENIKNVMQELLKLHKLDTNRKELLQFDLMDKILQMEDVLDKKNIGYGCGIPSEVEHFIHDIETRKEIKNYKSVVCHGDFHFDNVVQNEDKILICDLETLCLSDPVFDVVLFLVVDALGTNYHCSKMRDFLKDWKLVVGMYFSKRLTEAEVNHMQCVGLVTVYYCYLLALLNVSLPIDFIKGWFIRRYMLLKDLINYQNYMEE